MKRFVLIAAAVVVAACSGSTPAQPGALVSGSASTTASKPDGVVKNWVAHLVGTNEVPSRDTLAQGQVKFQLSADGTELSYQLISSNIDNVVASHIHVGAVGVNGPAVLFLFGNVAAGGGAQDGVLATGAATGGLVGPLAGQPLSVLIAEMDAGNTYVNVHTNDGVSPTNTGPGDFPGGEIRGQIERAGH